MIFEFCSNVSILSTSDIIKICIMSIIETVIYIVGWGTMIGIFNYLEKE